MIIEATWTSTSSSASLPSSSETRREEVIVEEKSRTERRSLVEAEVKKIDPGAKEITYTTKDYGFCEKP